MSREWVAVHLTSSPDSVAARVLSTRALDNEGLLADDLADRLADPGAELPDDEDVPLLLAISDNGGPGTGARNDPDHHTRQPQPASDHPMLLETQPETSRRVRNTSLRGRADR
ncbi:MAG: hypothetical protein OXG34_10525 [bacterium]|nr:hypothetical protein [bacterium]